MRKYSVNLFEKMVNSVETCKNGNHSFDKIGENYWFKYHGNTIFVIDFTDYTVIIDNCGFDTVSTTQAINSHLEAFLDFFPYTSSDFNFVDLTKNMKFNKKVVELFGKNAMNEQEFVELSRSW